MTPTIMRILGELGSVGSEPVRLRFNPKLFPPDIVAVCAARHADTITVTEHGEIALAAKGGDTHEALRSFSNELLAAAQDQEQE